jgi:hypothetical protein
LESEDVFSQSDISGKLSTQRINTQRMKVTANKLSELTLGLLVFVNSLAIIIYMAFISLICEDGLSGGLCVKQLDNRFFLVQIFINLCFTTFYILKINKRKWGILLINLLLTTVIYTVAAALHSISKAGLW